MAAFGQSHARLSRIQSKSFCFFGRPIGSEPNPESSDRSPNADVGFMAVGETGGFKKVIDPTARIFEYTSCPDEEFAEALEKSMKEEEGGGEASAIAFVGTRMLRT